MGVGLLVKKNTIETVISCKPVSSIVIAVRIAVKPINMTSIQVYAPQLVTVTCILMNLP